ncbi:Serine O-succinyltransferase [Polyrhizophydium stewartii]|uniref:Serine O-succinyltransferase n=1 Tax=Polyrhizophydium stewartii TaxID=2732419 RepID=A0ABR4NIG1_9FUNG|nr:hypothetical protein HK105_007738 [Polyrhizophydium stewartii]
MLAARRLPGLAARTSSVAAAAASPAVPHPAIRIAASRATLVTQSPPSPPRQALAFPCVDRLDERQRALEQGPEPMYEKVVQGYEVFETSEPLEMRLGGRLDGFRIAYETWGTLNAARDNVVLLHTGLSASSHARSHAKNPHPGWWESFIGPGLSIDTNKFFVICTNVIGGCYGSTGPSSPDPSDGKPYATRFPILTIFDMVNAQFKLLDSLGIRRLHASVGSSMGGMQSLAAAAMFPDRVGKLVTISAAARSHPYSIAMRFAQRQVLMTDPNWNRGFYYSGVFPHVGMKLARQIATITYRSGPEWERRFGRIRADPSAYPTFCADFLIETYLDHQSEKFCLTYDPNSLLYISKAMDMFDMSQLATRQDAPVDAASSAGGPATWEGTLKALTAGMSTIQMPVLVLGAQSDILFPIWQQKEIADTLKRAGNSKVSYYELDALYGHDTFLVDQVNVGSAVKGHLEIA